MTTYFIHHLILKHRKYILPKKINTLNLTSQETSTKKQEQKWNPVKRKQEKLKILISSSDIRKLPNLLYISLNMPAVDLEFSGMKHLLEHVVVLQHIGKFQQRSRLQYRPQYRYFNCSLLLPFFYLFGTTNNDTITSLGLYLLFARTWRLCKTGFGLTTGFIGLHSITVTVYTLYNSLQ
jgi:hypothetical protein